MQDDKSSEICDLHHLDRVFPVVDRPSTLLMKVKARCLFGAGAITAAQLAEVDRRAGEVIGCAEGPAGRAA